MFQFVAKKTRNVRSDRWKKVIQTQKQNSAKQTANADITEESIPETTSKKPKAKTNKNNKTQEDMKPEILQQAEQLVDALSGVDPQKVKKIKNHEGLIERTESKVILTEHNRQILVY